jgi:hypothetical protein
MAVSLHEPRWHDDEPGAALRAVPPNETSALDDMVAEVVWHGGGAEREWDALLRLVFDPIMEQLHDTAATADDEGACPW